MDIYTGFIVETNLTFEVKNPKGKVIDIGSVCSGGEYLVSKFKGDDFKGSGVSFGSDRLCFSVQQLDQIEINQENPVIVCVMDEKYLPKYIKCVTTISPHKHFKSTCSTSEISLYWKTGRRQIYTPL